MEKKAICPIIHFLSYYLYSTMGTWYTTYLHYAAYLFRSIYLFVFFPQDQLNSFKKHHSKLFNGGGGGGDADEWLKLL